MTDHDHEIRPLLKAWLRPCLGLDALVIDELDLARGAVRADVVVADQTLEAFEIKAAKDSLKRLPAQIEAYDAVFEHAWLVTTPRHLAEAQAILPAWWGILIADKSEHSASLTQVRPAAQGERRQGLHLARLLWRDELLMKLDELGRLAGIKNKPKIVLYEHLADAMPVHELSAYVRSCLRSRSNWRTAA
ncbi:hypothetical protein ABIC83_002786 [Roseateles asaccharophilus]|uniref:sce7726 family protein n=1 Tax=Roseateles asaccharophilus TaxID=582607 RepID=UPI003839B70A